MPFTLVNLSGLPTRGVSEIVEFARGSISSRGLTVIVREHHPGERKDPFHGWFLPGARTWNVAADGATTQAIELVILARLRRKPWLEVHDRRGRSPVLHGWCETLLHLAAHEWWHRLEFCRWRRQRPRRPRVRYDQRAADRYADGRLAGWRARNGKATR